MIRPESRYTAGVMRAVDELTAAKFKVTVLKSAWRKNQDNLAYRGINLTVEDLAAKQIEHGYYDWRVEPRVPDIELAYAQAQSDAIFGAVRFPDDAIRIGFKDGKAVMLSD